MFLVMADVAQRNQIFFGVFSTVRMMIHMVQLKVVSRVRGIRFIVIPAAFHTLKMVSLQYCATNRIFNDPVMFR